ncbi:hypothetical protein VTN02DRAFT_3812 [Thermoascus thermophilus]
MYTYTPTSAFLVLSPSYNVPESPIDRQSEATGSPESLPEQYHKTQRSNSSSSESLPPNRCDDPAYPGRTRKRIDNQTHPLRNDAMELAVGFP